MTISGMVFLVCLVGITLYAFSIYNRLIQIRLNVDKSWANIEVLEKQRYDEIQNLVRVCEGYIKYEKETLVKITEARTKYLEAQSPKQVAEAGSELTSALKSLFAVSENYPELKANTSFMQLQQRISYVESQIADRREYYNDSVMIFNTRITQVPDVLIANLLDYRDRDMYQAPEESKQVPEVNFELPA
jgi:LemA protein